MQYITIDLCAGIGGIRKGFELAGDYKNIISAETDEFACKTYEHLFGDDPRNDLTSSDFKTKVKQIQYDVLLAGFPCQTFSSVGLKLGFEDTTKGTIFFDIKNIIKDTTPKVLFLENVENLVTHDKGNTFRIIIETLENELNYKVLGVTKDEQGKLFYNPRSFIKNSKYFGVPQNRPRVYIIAFSRKYFNEYISLLPEEIPDKSNKIVYRYLKDILEINVPVKYFLSSGYLETLERHFETQKSKGNGFGYRVINLPGNDNPIANTLLATGGSGRERNLIYDISNGLKYTGTTIKGKYSPINEKFIRTMTPTEWGRLQGFIGYAFVKADGSEGFSFPDNIPDSQKYKQFGNSVTIPVIEFMALFIKECMNKMLEKFTDLEKRLFYMYGLEFHICKRIYDKLYKNVREKTIHSYFDLVYHVGIKNYFTKYSVARFLNVSEARAYQIILQLKSNGCITEKERYGYTFNIN